MLIRSRSLILPLALLFGGMLSGCTSPPMLDDPTGIAYLDRVLAFLANPNVAYLLLVLGLLALIAEFTTPGATVPGALGAVMLALSLYGLLKLPTNWLGPVLILTGVILLLVDIKVTGIALSVSGIVAFLLGSLLIFTPPWVMRSAAAPVARLNPLLIVGTTAGVGVFFFMGVAAAVRAQFHPVAMGRETLVGKTGVVRQPLQPDGIVRVEGEEWTAEAVTDEALPSGTPVRVVSVEGLRLLVEKIGDDGATT